MSNSKNIIPPTPVSNKKLEQKKRFHNKIKPALAGLTATTLGLSGTFLIASPANAYPGYSSAEAQYLSGSLLNIPLEDLVELEGETATAEYGSDATSVQSSNLNLNVLGDTITLQVADGVQVPINLADAGVIGQYASANPNGNSFAASGLVNDEGVVNVDPDTANPPGPLTLDLTDLLGADITGQIANVTVTADANTATATQNGNAAATGTYNVAGLNTTMTSPTVAGLSDTISSAATPLEDSVNAVVGPNGSVVTSLTGLLNETGVVTSDVSVDLDLNPIVDDVLAENQILGADGPVTVNLADGTIVVDIAALLAANGIDINNLEPGTEILNTQLAGFITAEVDSLVNGLLDEVNEAVTTTLESTVLNLNVTVGDVANPLLTVAINGPLSDISDGTLVSTVTLGDDVDLDPALLNSTLQTVVNNVLGLQLNTLALDTALDGLYPAVDNVLSDVVSLTANNQETTAGVFTETALRLSLLNFDDANGEALTLNLAQASVGPNALVADPANPDTVVVSFTPTEGPEAGGTDVTILGTGFTGADEVLFGTTPATAVNVISDTEIIATSPAGTGSVPLTVSGTQYGDALSPGLFTYLPVSVTSFTPTEGPEAGGTPVVITGTGFTTVDSLSFGTIPAATFNVVSDTQITATTSAGTGSVPIVLGTDNGDITSTQLFTFLPDNANGTIISINPNQGPEAGGTPVVITGTGFTGADDVLFGPNEASNVVVVSDTQITAVTPLGEGTVPLAILGTDGGNIVSDVTFTYNAAAPTGPVIDSFTPTQGPTTGGTVITITGTGFTNVNEVLVGQTPATNVTIVSDTEITATTPAGTGSVPITIGTTDGGTSTSTQNFTYNDPTTDGNGNNNGNNAGNNANGNGNGNGKNGDDKLAQTGTNMAFPIGLGIMSLIGGAGLLFLNRKFSF
jgi:LPXTG-motif cell wall-anchored protein